MQILHLKDPLRSHYIYACACIFVRCVVSARKPPKPNATPRIAHCVACRDATSKKCKYYIGRPTTRKYQKMPYQSFLCAFQTFITRQKIVLLVSMMRHVNATAD